MHLLGLLSGPGGLKGALIEETRPGPAMAVSDADIKSMTAALEAKVLDSSDLEAQFTLGRKLGE